MKSNQYSHEGLAELVHQPTPLTFSFLEYWFRGDTSLGLAMDLLGLPCKQKPLSVFTLEDKDLVVDLNHQEQLMYQSTVLAYRDDQLRVSARKLIQPWHWPQTIQLIAVQGWWLAQPEEILKQAHLWLDQLDVRQDETSIQFWDEFLWQEIWPVVIAVGFLSEFFFQAYKKDSSLTELPQDWLYTSLADQQKIQSGEMSFTEYLDEYGLRADNDYELTCPRWYEQSEKILQRAKSYPTPSHGTPTIKSIDNQNDHVQIVTEFQPLRSLAKQKALVGMDKLRQALLQHQPDGTLLAQQTRNQLLGIEDTSREAQTIEPEKDPRFTETHVFAGTGTSIAQGQVQGSVVLVESPDQTIPPNSIGVFPNASPAFAVLYPLCLGMIFVRGGQTSHGAIVAREYGIPALVDKRAAKIPEGSQITLDGSTGEWELL